MANKRVGKKSQAANDFLEPKPPINVVATDIGTSRPYNNAAASVSFELPAGSPPATSYTVTASTGQSASGASSPIGVGGFPSGATPTFTVTATNASGTSAASSASSAVTLTTVPNAPTVSATNIGTGRAFGNGAATITASAINGGKAISAFTSGAVSGGSPLTVTGLSGGTAYTFSVTATNANGTSAATTTNSITATTVPATPSAPTATTGVNQDTIQWTAPGNGGSVITSYTWASSDAKGATISGTSTTVTQEGSTSQTYTVYATNANGNSGTSAASNSVTTTPPFFPPFNKPDGAEWYRRVG
jgi:hypothetical protein